MKITNPAVILTALALSATISAQVRAEGVTQDL
jgi:hypothetical protein